MGLYARVLRYLAPYRFLITAAVTAIFGFAMLDAFSIVVLIPFLNALFGDEPIGVGSAGDGAIGELLRATLGRFVDPAAAPEDVLVAIIIFILGVYLLKNVFDFLQRYLVVRLEQGVTRDLRNEIYEHLLKLDLRFFGGTRAGQILSRLTGDVDKLRAMMTRNTAKLVTSAFQVVVMLVMLLAISVQLTVIALVVMPLLFGIWQRLVKRLRKGDRQVLNLEGEVMSHLQETVSGIRLVKASAAEAFERGRFRGLTDRYYRAYVRVEALRATASPLTEMIGAVGTVLLLWWGGRMVLVEQAIDGGTFLAFLGLSLKLYQPAKWLSKFPASVQRALAASERVFEFLDAPIEIRNRPAAREFEGVRERIRFEDVSFAYVPGEPVLEGIDIEARAGDVVALVGPSGAGKTTLADLLARFYDPTGGRITIDGVDLREFGIESLRSRLGVVTQETVLFHDTVRANIAYGWPDAPDDAIEQAARTANAHGFITNLADGYDTVLGERGTRLSGGQRQRISIARAILSDPPVLIFDEATSALDSESERLVQDAIERLLAGRTVFVIAHRLSTVMHADQILVLRDGRIVEHGRHEELLSRDGTYRRLYDLQLASG